MGTETIEYHVDVVGTVQAGVWRETGAGDGVSHATLPIRPDLRYPRARQFALKVVGSSMNKVFPDGQYVICIRWADLGRELRDGDIVVVERRRDGMIETTLKRARIRGDATEFVPESTDAKHQTPIVLDIHSDHDEIAVTGLAIGRYEPL